MSNKYEREESLDVLTTSWMMQYGVNVNLQRAIPMVTDGLKPVWRKILYSVWKNCKTQQVKVATVQGDVTKLYPHSDMGMNALFGRLAQPFTNNAPLLNAHGNCGTMTVGNDTAAARYWGVSLSKFAMDVLFDEFDGTVNMIPNYDNRFMEPTVLPAKFPLILLNGTSGIGYTLSTDIPPYNLNEVADAAIKLLKNSNAKIKLVPDSPTGCDMIVLNDTTFVMQSSVEIDNVNYVITIKNTPYMQFLTDIEKRLCEIQNPTNSITPIPEIISADDESELLKNELRYVIRCKPCNLYKVMDTLFKRVGGLRSTISTRNMLVVDKFQTKEYDVRQILRAWIENRLRDKRLWCMRRLVDLTTEHNMLTGKAFMLSPENLNTTIKVFRSCNAKSEIIPALVDKYKGEVTTSQANYVSELKVYNLTNGEYQKTLKDIKTVQDEIDHLRPIVTDPEKIRDVVIDEIKTIKNKYGSPRRSKILNAGNQSGTNIGVVQILPDGSVVFSETENVEQLASNVTPVSNDNVCLVDEFGQFIWVDTNKVKHDIPYTLTSIGKSTMGKCVSCIVNPGNDIVIMTNLGRIKYMPISRIPSNATRKPLLPLQDDEVIVSIVEMNGTNQDLLVYTSDGYGKRIPITTLNKVLSVDASGQFIMKDMVNVSGMFALNVTKPLLVYVTKLGRIRVNHAKFLTGVKKFAELKPIIKLSSQDDLIGVFCANPGQTITLNHADGRVTTVHIDSLPILTMSAEPVRPKHVPGVKVIRASLT